MLAYINSPSGTVFEQLTIMDILGAAVVEVGKRMFMFLFTKTSILANFRRNIRSLKCEFERLQCRKAEIEEDIRLAKREGRCPTVEINGWIRQVEAIEREMLQMLEETRDVSANDLTLRSRYRLSKKASTKREEVKRLLVDLCKLDTLVPDGKLPIVPVEKMSAPSLAGQKAAEEMLKKLVAYLNDDEISRIAVWGMGGIGKTTLVRNLNNFLESTSGDSFDIVIWATVSKDLDLRRVQSRIAERLNIEFVAGESTEGRAVKIHQTLINKKFLLILDDVWEKLDLDIVGVPRGSNQENCKILLTTRNIDVCRGMMTNAEIKMDVVDDEVSWNLFAESAGSIISSENIAPLARAIAWECCGLPLAIKTVGTSMRGQTMIQLWEHTLSQLQGSTLKEEVYRPLELSYDSLPSKTHKLCFLFCSLFPENFSIRKSELIQCWRAIGLIDVKQTLEKSFNNGLALIESLKGSCMLEQGDGVETVRMHGILRDLAVQIGKGEGFFSQASESLIETKLQDSFSWISLMNNKMKKLPNPTVKCSKLTVLFLQGNPIKKIPDNFFCEMKTLRVLNLSRTHIKSLPPSLFNLEDLRTLLLRECYYLEKLPPLGDLYQLEVLDLSATGLTELPPDMGMLSSLKELNLGDTRCLENIAAGTISGLDGIEALNMWSSAYKWDARFSAAKEKASFDELLSLQKLSALHLRLDSIDCLLNVGDWLKRLKSFNITVSPRSIKSNFPVFQYDEKRVTLRGVDLMRKGLEGLLCNATTLELINCGVINNLSELVVRNNLKGLSGLKLLVISSCDCLTSLIDGDTTLRGMLPNLEHLKLSRLHNLEKILVRIVPVGGCLSKLRVLEVADCPRLKNLMSFALLRQFQKLEEIRIGNCRRIKFLVEARPEAVLAKLKILKMWDMTRLRSVSSKAMELPALEKIEVNNCPLLLKLPITERNASNVKEIRGEMEWLNELMLQKQNEEILRQICRVFVASTSIKRKNLRDEVEKSSSWQSLFPEKFGTTNSNN